MILSGGGGGGGRANSVLDLGGSCKFCTDLGGGHMNSARAWPPFSGPPQPFSNEHSLRGTIDYSSKSKFIHPSESECHIRAVYMNICTCVVVLLVSIYTD